MKQSAAYKSWYRSVQRHPFLRYLYRWGQSDRNCNVAIVGETRSGKSLAGKLLVEAMTPPKLEPKIIFTLEELLALMRDRTMWNRWILMDELELEVASIRWYEERAKILGEVFQSFAYMRLNIIATMPHLAFLTKQSRAMIHVLIRMIKQKVGFPYRLKWSFLGNKVYPKKFFWQGKPIYLRFPTLPKKEIQIYWNMKDKRIYNEKLKEWEEGLALSKAKKQKEKTKMKKREMRAELKKSSRKLVGLKGEAFKKQMKKHLALKDKYNI